jgi:plastocyanin
MSTRRLARAVPLLPVAIVLSLGLPAGALAAGHSVGIANFAYTPTPLTVAVGDSVIWSNEGFITHTVTAADDSFDSGKIRGGTTFTFQFQRPGEFQYACSIHPRMHGEVIVKAEHGEAQTGPSPHAPVPPPALPRPGVGGSGPPGIALRLSRLLRGHRQMTAIAVRVTRPGAKVLLELYSREHFSWRQVAHATTDAEGRATLWLRATVRLPLRVVVPGNDGEVASISAVLHS